MADGAISRGASPNLDFLRSAAVLMVLFDHLCRRFYLDHLGWFGVADVGVFGVLLFFVHTSLVLMYSMQRSGLHGMALVKNFAIRRVFRIYPLSILAVLTAVALHLHADGRGISFGPRPGAVEFVSNLLLIQNLTFSDSIIGPLWSLPIELQMYLLLPILFLWRKRSFWKLIFLWGLSGILGHLLVFPALGWFTLLLYIQLPAGSDCLRVTGESDHPVVPLASIHSAARRFVRVRTGSQVRCGTVPAAGADDPAVPRNYISPIAIGQQVDRHLLLWDLPGTFILYLVYPHAIP